MKKRIHNQMQLYRRLNLEFNMPNLMKRMGIDNWVVIDEHNWEEYRDLLEEEDIEDGSIHHSFGNIIVFPPANNPKKPSITLGFAEYDVLDIFSYPPDMDGYGWTWHLSLLLKKEEDMGGRRWNSIECSKIDPDWLNPSALSIDHIHEILKSIQKP